MIPMRILLVDDHGETLVALSKLLRLSGYVVETAGSAAEARTIAARERYDLLVSDLGLPDGSGADLMRDLQRLYSVPGIAMTGFGEERLLVECEGAGFARRIIKPVAFEELLKAIREVAPAPCGCPS